MLGLGAANATGGGATEASGGESHGFHGFIKFHQCPVCSLHCTP